MIDVLLNVLAVIGLIVVGGFVVIFLGNVLLNVLDSDNSKNSKQNKQEQVQPTYMIQQEPQPIQIQESVRLIEEPKQEPQITEYADIDFDKAAEEERMLNGGQETVDDAFARLRAEEEAFKQERLRFIEERRKIEEERAKQEQEVSFDDEDELDLDDIFFDDEDEDVLSALNEIEEADAEVNQLAEEMFEEESEEEIEQAQEIEEQPVEAEEQEELVEEEQEDENLETEEEPVEDEVVEEEISIEKPVDDQKLVELEQELAKQRAELEEYRRIAEEERKQLMAKNQELIEKLEATEAQVVEVSDVNLSLEEYEARLEVLQERLKANEKELKANKKEYLPLAKVRKSLENDKKKLRRREALVAKQKVVLYGVNNIVDIDEEKAKKLAEDLDLLDGLRVSVQHCEEVMAQNAERLPILEKTYNILSENSKILKADIEEVERKIAEIKAQEQPVDVDDKPEENGEGDNN